MAWRLDMNIDRKYLYWGVFFIAAGAVVLVGQSDLVDSDVVERALELWPVLVIALGVGLLLRRTRFGVAGGMLAAAVPGLLIGGIVVAAPVVTPDLGMECDGTRPVSLETRQGTFPGAGSVDLHLTCGDLTVTTLPGNGWSLETGNDRGKPAVVEVSTGRLSVVSAAGGRPFGLHRGADAWRLALPTADALGLTAEVSAGHGDFDLAGARLGAVRLAVNAGEGRIDLGGATLADLSLDVNAAKASLILPADDFAADLDVNAASLKICAPSELGLRIHHRGVLGSSDYTGLVRNGDAWESPDYALAIHHADVTVSVNVGSVDLDPVGGCK